MNRDNNNNNNNKNNNNGTCCWCQDSAGTANTRTNFGLRAAVELNNISISLLERQEQKQQQQGWAEQSCTALMSKYRIIATFQDAVYAIQQSECLAECTCSNTTTITCCPATNTAATKTTSASAAAMDNAPNCHRQTQLDALTMKVIESKLQRAHQLLCSVSVATAEPLGASSTPGLVAAIGSTATGPAVQVASFPCCNLSAAELTKTTAAAMVAFRVFYSDPSSRTTTTNNTGAAGQPSPSLEATTAASILYVCRAECTAAWASHMFGDSDNTNNTRCPYSSSWWTPTFLRINLEDIQEDFPPKYQEEIVSCIILYNLAVSCLLYQTTTAVATTTTSVGTTTTAAAPCSSLKSVIKEASGTLDRCKQALEWLVTEEDISQQEYPFAMHQMSVFACFVLQALAFTINVKAAATLQTTTTTSSTTTVTRQEQQEKEEAERRQQEQPILLLIKRKRGDLNGLCDGSSVDSCDHQQDKIKRQKRGNLDPVVVCDIVVCDDNNSDKQDNNNINARYGCDNQDNDSQHEDEDDEDEDVEYDLEEEKENVIEAIYAACEDLCYSSCRMATAPMRRTLIRKTSSRSYNNTTSTTTTTAIQSLAAFAAETRSQLQQPQQPIVHFGGSSNSTILPDFGSHISTTTTTTNGSAAPATLFWSNSTHLYDFTSTAATAAAAHNNGVDSSNHPPPATPLVSSSGTYFYDFATTATNTPPPLPTTGLSSSSSSNEENALGQLVVPGDGQQHYELDENLFEYCYNDTNPHRKTILFASLQAWYRMIHEKTMIFAPAA